MKSDLIYHRTQNSKETSALVGAQPNLFLGRQSMKGENPEEPWGKDTRSLY